MIMKVYLYANCWNEMKILPFVVDYWKQFVTKAFVYDNGSTDGSVEFLSSFDWIEVRELISDGFNDQIIANFKNNEWKKDIDDSVDFVVCCDIDECIYHPDIIKVLEDLKRKQIALIHPKMYNIVSLDFPEYVDGKLLHEICPQCKECESKTLMFDPSLVREMSYTVGCHKCYPKFVYPHLSTKDLSSLYVFHCKQLSIDYVIKRYMDLQNRLSDLNKKMLWGVHYAYSEDKIKTDFNTLWKTSVNVNEILEHE